MLVLMGMRFISPPFMVSIIQNGNWLLRQGDAVPKLGEISRLMRIFFMVALGVDHGVPFLKKGNISRFNEI